MRTLFAYFIQRPLLVNLAMLFALAMGAHSLHTGVYSAYPSFDYGAFSLSTYYPGSSPQDIELNITAPLEEELLKVEGISELKSNSMEGISAILIEARDDASDSEVADLERDLQRAIDRAGGRLPGDLPEKPALTKLRAELMPIIELLVVGDIAESLLRDVADSIEDELRELDGIASIDKRSYRDREIRIQLDPVALHRLSLNIDEIEQAIRARNVSATGGALESYVAEKDVIAVGRFGDPKEVADLIIRAPEAGNYVRLGDIATIVADYEDWSVRTFINGVPGVYLGLRRTLDANELTVVAAVREKVAEINTRLPAGVELRISNDLSRFTVAMLNTLVYNGLLGVALVFALLLVFFPWRSAFWVVSGMPTAIFIGFALMPLFGLTINQFTLAAIILMLGLLVDDAIVTSESIFRHHEQGLAPRQAALEGTMAVAPAVITGAITTLLAFTPLIFLGGKEGKFMWMLPMMVVLIISASLLECKLILPGHIAHALGASPEKHISARWFSRIERRYRQVLAGLIAHRYASLAGLTLLFAAMLILGSRWVSIDLWPETDVDVVHIKAQLPRGSSFEHTYQQVRLVEQRIHELLDARDLQNTRLTVGTHDVGRPDEVNPGNQSAWATLDIFLQPNGVRQINAIALASMLRADFQRFGQFDNLQVFPKNAGPPIGYPVETQVIANHDARAEVADALLEFLQRQPGVTEAWTSYHPGKDIVNLAFNHEAIADYGLQVADITRTLRIAFDGYIVDELQTVGERIKYRLQFQEPQRGEPETLRSLTLINRDGERIPLRAVAEFEVTPGQASIRHYFGKRVETVYAEIDPDIVSVQAINDALADHVETQGYERQHPGLRIRQRGELSSQQATLSNVGGTMLVILVAIFFVMVLLFNSLTQPLLVIALIPIGFLGVLLAFALHGFDLSMPSLMGFLGLSGVVVNSAIVMIDRLNQRRSDGIVGAQQIIDGAGERLRPILLTSLTTVAGLAPAAYGWMGSNPFLTPMIMAMLWGIAFGTTVAMLYLPCLYAIDQDLQLLISRFRSRR